MLMPFLGFGRAKKAGYRHKIKNQYGTGPRVLDLSKPYFVSTCQRFVEKYEELRSKCELKESSLFEETGKALLAEGVILRKRGALPYIMSVLKMNAEHFQKGRVKF
uniref:Small ribosomal subunit protein mS23 conserved domain-containing protein n=1 Tax=Salarias fasciatus TaxID=181472 RepID=A0A672HY93_SALFA